VAPVLPSAAHPAAAHLVENHKSQKSAVVMIFNSALILVVVVGTATAKSTYDVVVQAPLADDGISTRQIRIGDTSVRVPDKVRDVWERLREALVEALKGGMKAHGWGCA